MTEFLLFFLLLLLAFFFCESFIESHYVTTITLTGIIFHDRGLIPIEAIPRYQKNKEWLRPDHIGAVAIHADVPSSESGSMEQLFRLQLVDP